MSGLIERYDHPKGTFDQAAVGDVVEHVEARLARLKETRLLEVLADLFESLQQGVGGDPADPAPQAKFDSDGRTISITGNAEVSLTRTCDGWSSPPVPAADNGRIVLHAAVSDIRIEPVLWAQVEGCKYSSPAGKVTLDGRRSSPSDLWSEFPSVGVSVYVGETATIENLDEQSFLVALDLRTTVMDPEGALIKDLDFDFRASGSPATLEVRVPVSDGDLILVVADDSIIEVRASNGVFECDVTTGRCLDNSGHEVDLYQ